ncbi:hypothetical protein HanRHA438_Chr02g0054071 [Helianthus annuus]|nr:hypothetical protein HanIR_Chr02g0058071 [Helianthus annuus]KAJ0938822.1 hypothetical protein HanRHA438_Chr02g0054071 [Helianthus annuus]
MTRSRRTSRSLRRRSKLRPTYSAGVVERVDVCTRGNHSREFGLPYLFLARYFKESPYVNTGNHSREFGLPDLFLARYFKESPYVNTADKMLGSAWNSARRCLEMSPS